MRYLSANYIFPLHINPIKEGVVQISEKGEIVNIFESRTKAPKQKLEIFEGVLCPGFVNVHCHLELSHLKGLLLQKTGLVDFISKVPEKRNLEIDDIKRAIIDADSTMQKNGIVAVGDISNTNHSFFIKEESKIVYHTFVELFSLNKDKAEIVFNKGMDLLNNCPNPRSITPHATYSVSEKLFSLLKEKNNGEIVCIHNQETKSEDELFRNGSGELYEFIKQFGDLNQTGISALQTSLLQMSKQSKIILVHNTFTSKKDVKWTKENNYDTYWCTCPKANLYIENSLPDYSIFDTDTLCVGTDSLASNNSLSILEELKVLKENSDFDLNTLLKIACKNGAEALGFENLGTFEKGKIPGLNLINNLDSVSVIA